MATAIAPSSNGKTTVSDTVYRGSNPRGASVFFLEIQRLALIFALAGALLELRGIPWGSVIF